MASELIEPHVWGTVEQSRCVVCGYTHDLYQVVMSHIVQRHPELLEMDHVETPAPATILGFELTEDQTNLTQEENE
jgi:hypothetical protein